MGMYWNLELHPELGPRLYGELNLNPNLNPNPNLNWVQGYTASRRAAQASRGLRRVKGRLEHAETSLAVHRLKINFKAFQIQDRAERILKHALGRWGIEALRRDKSLNLKEWKLNTLALTLTLTLTLILTLIG